MGHNMPFDPVYTGIATVPILILIILLLVTRIRHRFLVRKVLLYLIGQDQYEYILIDIRGSREFNRGHIPNAQNVPFAECPGYLPTENMFEKIIVYGRSRRRARMVAKMLDKTGYFNVSFYGSFRSWNGPVETTDTDEEKNER